MDRRTLVFKDEGQSITSFFSSKGQNIIIAGALQNLGKRLEVDAESHGSITSIVFKSIVGDEERYEGHMGRIQSLHGDASWRAIKVHLFVESNESFEVSIWSKTRAIIKRKHILGQIKVLVGMMTLES